jgi:autotransporter-associated beta strand protein
LNGASPTLASITFNNSATRYSIASGSGGSLQMSNGSNSATIEVVAGTHSVQAGLSLSSNLAIDTSANSSLSIAGPIAGAGQSLTKTGEGSLTISGSNTFTGGTTVLGGSLIVQNGASLGGSLAIGNGAIVTIAASDANGNPLAAAGAFASAEAKMIAAATAASDAPNPNPPPLPSVTAVLATMSLPSTFRAAFRSLPTTSAIAEPATKKPIHPAAVTTIAAPPDAPRPRHSHHREESTDERRFFGED